MAVKIKTVVSWVTPLYTFMGGDESGKIHCRAKTFGIVQE
jgi:hypothetical protein